MLCLFLASAHGQNRTRDKNPKGAPDKWHNFAMNLNCCCERDTDTETGRTSERREREREREREGEREGETGREKEGERERLAHTGLLHVWLNQKVYIGVVL